MAFNLGCFCLGSAGLRYGLIAASAANLEAHFLQVIDPAGSARRLGILLGSSAMATAITLPFAGMAVTRFGMRTLLMAACIVVVIGFWVALGADPTIQGPNAYYRLVAGFAFAGLGGGLIEAVIGPLVERLYPSDRIARMNALHSFWPLGIAVGSLIGALITGIGFSWRWAWGVGALPSFPLLIFLYRIEFPSLALPGQTLSSRKALRACLAPGFIFLASLMIFSAMTELLPGPWLDISLTSRIGLRGIYLMTTVAFLMFFMRRWQRILRLFRPFNLLAISCGLASIGLFILAKTHHPIWAWVGVILWGAGACFLWPTMMVATAERFPATGAIGMALMAMLGTCADFVGQPLFGWIFDKAKLKLAGGEIAFSTLSAQNRPELLARASQEAFFLLAIIPLLLVPLFLAFRHWERRAGHP